MPFSSTRQAALALAIAAAGGASLSASAATIDWATWSNVNPAASSGTATASFSTLGATATYSGELEQFVAGYPSYTPNATFSGGTVSNAPSSASGIVRIFGGSATTVDTITFSQAVVNPVLAIWSLGQPGYTAEFDFRQPFVIESGGPNAEYGGASITAVGNTVYGAEGNGTIQFLGTFSSISWTNPTYENWYGFTVGAQAVAVPGVPEPETYALLVAGLGAVGAIARRRRRAD